MSDLDKIIQYAKDSAKLSQTLVRTAVATRFNSITNSLVQLKEREITEDQVNAACQAFYGHGPTNGLWTSADAMRQALKTFKDSL